jgi:hypothetical protein
MSSTTENNGYVINDEDDLDIVTILTDWPANWTLLDGRTAKWDLSASAAPTANDDSSLGFADGSVVIYDHVIYYCESALLASAIWRQVWPPKNSDISGTISDGQLATSYLKADGSRGLSADLDVGAHQVRAETLQADVATGTAPLVIASTTKVSNLNVDQVDGCDDTAFVKHSLATAENDFLVASGAGAFVKKTLAETRTIIGGSSVLVNQVFS